MALTKADIAEHLFEKLGINKKDAKDLVEAFFEEIRSALEKGEQVKLSGFGNFDLRDKKEREGMVWVSNPFFEKNDRETWNRGEPVEVFSAFGGFPIIKSKILNKVEWSTDGDIEHKNFCRDIRKYGKIIVVPKIITRVIISQNTLDHLSKIYDSAISKQWKRFLIAD